MNRLSKALICCGVFAMLLAPSMGLAQSVSIGPGFGTGHSKTSDTKQNNSTAVKVDLEHRIYTAWAFELHGGVSYMGGEYELVNNTTGEKRDTNFHYPHVYGKFKINLLDGYGPWGYLGSGLYLEKHNEKFGWIWGAGFDFQLDENWTISPQLYRPFTDMNKQTDVFVAVKFLF